MSAAGSTTRRMTSEQLRDALTSAASGRPGAWNHLFRGLQTFAESQVRQYLGFQPWQEQRESIQTVLEYLWRDRLWVMRYEPNADPVPYVLTVVRRSVYRCRRGSYTAKRRNVVLADDSDGAVEPGPADDPHDDAGVRDLENRQTLQWVAKWMQTLSQRDQRLFSLRRFEGVPGQEVAVLLEMEEDAVHQQFRRLNGSLISYLASNGIVLLLALLMWGLPWLTAWMRG